MIVFDLECRAGGHRFEGWFRSSDDFADQQDRRLVTCPQCGSAEVEKAVMAPNVGRKGNQRLPARRERPAEPDAPASPPALPPQALAMIAQLARMQTEALKDSEWVGENFAEDARAMHYGERNSAPIHGEATLAEARDLLEEGIAVAPLPFPVVPPEKAN